MCATHSRLVIVALKADGWFRVAQKGDHVQFKQPEKPGRVTVPHPNRDLPIGTLKSIEKQSGLKLRQAMRQYIALIHKTPAATMASRFQIFPAA